MVTLWCCETYLDIDVVVACVLASEIAHVVAVEPGASEDLALSSGHEGPHACLDLHDEVDLVGGELLARHVLVALQLRLGVVAIV